MKEAIQLQNIQQINELLSKLSDELDSQEAKKAVQVAYNKINVPTKTSEKYKQVPDAIAQMKKDFSRLSLVKKTHFTRSQEAIVTELTTFTRQTFQKGFDGIAYANIWFG